MVENFAFLQSVTKMFSEKIYFQAIKCHGRWMWCTGLPLDTMLVGVVHWVTIRYHASGRGALGYH